MRYSLAIAALTWCCLSPVHAQAHQTTQQPAQLPVQIVAAQPFMHLISVPAGTAVPVRVVGIVSSSSMNAGDDFSIQAAQDVIVNGMIVIRAGALGSGKIGDVDHAGGNGHSGALNLQFDWIYAADGGKVHLAPATQRQAEDDRKGASSTATIVGFATFGLGGLFGHNLAHGREITVDDRNSQCVRCKHRSRRCNRQINERPIRSLINDQRAAKP